MSDREVLTCRDLEPGALAELVGRFDLELHTVAPEADIPASYWGAPEAGLRGSRVYIRVDTPVHSALHEACHAICMDDDRRHCLDTDAGGDESEENAVCYLQILLAEHLRGVGATRLMLDMDRWGYSFRLGSAKAWFTGDAEEARQWLIDAGRIDAHGAVCWGPRQQART